MSRMSIELLPLAIKKCFLKELEHLVSKYTPFSNYTDETVKAAISILEKVGDTSIDDLGVDYLLEVLEMLKQYNQEMV